MYIYIYKNPKWSSVVPGIPLALPRLKSVGLGVSRRCGQPVTAGGLFKED